MNSIALVEWLKELYPNRLPHKEISSFELGILIGQQQVVEQLILKMKVEGVSDEIIK